jgi:hypothetical protein
MTDTKKPPSFAGQYRLRGSRHWSTYTERPSAGEVWDELLITTEIPPGADLRVIPTTDPQLCQPRPGA